MKLLILNGSIHQEGCIQNALQEIKATVEAEDKSIEVEIFWIGARAISDCMDCGRCNVIHRCVFDGDAVNSFLQKAAKADGFVFATPVYYAHPSGRILSFLDRTFFSEHSENYPSFRHKPAATIACARRGGISATIDVLSKYYGIAQMLTVGSTYWNMIHGQQPEDVFTDEEGMQTMRNLGRNMVWIMRGLELMRKLGLKSPENEFDMTTNFVRGRAT